MLQIWFPTYRSRWVDTPKSTNKKGAHTCSMGVPYFLSRAQFESVNFREQDSKRTLLFTNEVFANLIFSYRMLVHAINQI